MCILICEKEIIPTSEDYCLIHLTNIYANSHILYLLCVSIILSTQDAMINKIQEASSLGLIF